MFRILLVTLLLASKAAFADDEETTKPEALFDSESGDARYSTISGKWQKYEFEGEEMIRLVPEPVQQCRVELGPNLQSYEVTVSTKVLGKRKNRLAPRMGVGIFGEYGLTLRIAPGNDALELVQYGEVIADVSCKWSSAQWHFIELKMEPKGTFWQLEGRCWPSGAEKPVEAQLKHNLFPTSLTHPLFGKAFLTGSPFSGFPVFYDKTLVINPKSE